MSKFWLEDPCILLTDFNILPTAKLSTDEKLNALTRLILIISGIMYAMEHKHWITFLIIGMIMVLVVKILSGKNIEGFSIPPTYVDGAEPMTTIPPLHAEEWQSPPPIYDEYTNTPDCTNIEYPEERPIHGQYISSSRLFPFQTQEIHNRPLSEAQLYMSDEFTRDALQFRNDMTRNFVNRQDRIYRHGCYDQVSPYNSY